MARPTLQQLQYLVALDDHRHFGRAANAVSVSQPALSTQIRELEKRVGAPLVERTSKRVLFTPTGSDIANRARQILTSVDELDRRGQGDLVGPLRFGVIPTMAPYLLLHVVATMTNYPRARITLSEHRTPDLLVLLRSGSLDLAMLAGPVVGNDLYGEILAEDPFVLASSTRRAASKRRSLLRLDELAGESVLLLDDGHCLRDQALSICALADVPAVDVAATSLATLTQMVAADIGVTLLPSSTLAIEARPGSGIRIQQFHPPAPSRHITLAWRATSPRAAHYQAIAKLLRPLLREACKTTGS